MAAANWELSNRQPPVIPNGVNGGPSNGTGPSPPNGPHHSNGNSMPNGGMLANMPTPAGQALDYAVIHEMINELASLSASNRDEGRRVAERVHTIQEQSGLIDDDPLASLGPDASTISTQDPSQIVNAQKALLESARAKLLALAADNRRYERLVRHWETTAEQMVVRMRAHGVRVHASQMEWQRYWSAAWNRSRDEAIRYRAQVIEATDHARTLGVHLRRLVLAHQEEKERLVERAREREEGLLARILKLQEELLACGRHELAKDGVEGPLGDLQRGRGTEEQELEPGAGIMEEMLQAQHEEELEGRDFRLEMWKVDEVWRPGSGGGDEAEELRQEPALTTRPLVEELSMDLRQPTPPDQPEPTPVASDGAC